MLVSAPCSTSPDTERRTMTTFEKNGIAIILAVVILMLVYVLVFG
jgi:hypothetical protein